MEEQIDIMKTDLKNLNLSLENKEQDLNNLRIELKEKELKLK